MDLKGKYGLIIPAKEREAAAAKPPPPRRKANVFGEDSDSDADEDTDWVKKTMKKQSHGSIQQKQSVQAIKQALADDPTVYQYDELYDDMEQKRVNTKETEKKDRKAKYIENLLKTAEKRKLEDEARNERLVQKERENEGDMFKDKEAFVTGAYRKKMEDLEKVKEEERRRDQLDALVDVTKQKDLSGFYRHLYRQQLNAPNTKAEEAVDKPNNNEDELWRSEAVAVKQEPDSPHRHHANISISDRTPERDTELYVKEEDGGKSERSLKSPKREHRDKDERRDERRKGSRDRDSEDRRMEDRHRGHGGENRSNSRRDKDYDRHGGRSEQERDQRRQSDRDRGRDDDRRRDRDRDREERRGRNRSRDRRAEGDRDRRGERRDRDRHEPKRERTPEVRGEKRARMMSDKLVEEVIKAEVKMEEVENQEVKSSIWAKRTVGEVFDAALARYFARKQANTLQASVVPNHD